MHILEELAESYPQLYIVPGEEGEETYKEVVLKGKPVREKTLSHFRMSSEDDCRIEHTPASDNIYEKEFATETNIRRRHNGL